MKNILLLYYLFLLNIVSLAQNSNELISLEDESFGSYLKTSKIASVTGRISNISFGEINNLPISYHIVTPFGGKQLNKFTSVASDGTFSLELDHVLPYQQIWLNIGEKYYAGIYAHSDLFIALDWEKANKKNIYMIGDGVTYLGKDGDLNTYLNEYSLFKKQHNNEAWEGISNLLHNQVPERANIIKYDSLFKELQKNDQVFISQNNPSFAWIIENERMSDYYATFCAWHFSQNLPMDETLFNKVKNHKSFMVSNSGMHYYKYMLMYINSVGHFRDPAYLDSTFTPIKADFMKLQNPNKGMDIEQDVDENNITFKNIETPWLKEMLLAEQKKTLLKLKEVENTLKNSKSIQSSDLGSAILETSFGAKLYSVQAGTAKELLSRLKSNFKDKAVFIDFWATWCSPCLTELPNSKRLHEETTSLPLEFVYLCTSSSTTLDKWKVKVLELQIPGTHIFVDEKIEAELMDLFKGSGFPTYVFIDKNGNYQPKANLRGISKEKLTALVLK